MSEERQQRDFQVGPSKLGNARLILDHINDRIEGLVQFAAIECAIDFLEKPGQDHKLRLLCLNIMKCLAMGDYRDTQKAHEREAKISSLYKDIERLQKEVEKKDQEAVNLKAALKNKSKGEDAQKVEYRSPKPEDVGSIPTPPAKEIEVPKE